MASESNIKLSFPYSVGDAIDGFKYGRDMSTDEYNQKLIDNYNKYRNSIVKTFSERFTMNMSINNYTKEHNTYRKQDYYYEDTFVYLYDDENNVMDIDKLLYYFQNEEPFVMMIDMYQLYDFPELETEVKGWGRESRKVMTCDKLNDNEKIKSLTKKNLKLKFVNSNSSAILENCRMIDYINNKSFVILIEKIIFVTNK